ncbi:hypothetical protein HMPREF9257_0735 [Eremococcus coleocola ACS-139-V-Col8]|uniref:Uncharacterized protein n=1 Tax=Eremococcus coleocola ACS-139-V-Col8 TaxID=908337 RepID=E4KR22_9LACT|nr:hypothetical protein HMPREF9257_0735 [Eremococcus coleocola ACS-139-V-Col8]
MAAGEWGGVLLDKLKSQPSWPAGWAGTWLAYINQSSLSFFGRGIICNLG